MATAQQPKSSSSVAGTPSVQGFSVALVLGDLQGSAKADNVPEGARKALADLRDFLPYKSYRLLDTQWILCCGSTKVGTGISGRLRGVSQALGPDEQEYPFNVNLVGVSGSQLSVRFVMTDGAGPLKKSTMPKPSPDDTEKAVPREKELEKMQRQVEEIARAAGSKGTIIDSTFSMDIGETVVIGTSSLKGDKALIAVLTAAKRPPRKRRHLEKSDEPVATSRCRLRRLPVLATSYAFTKSADPAPLTVHEWGTFTSVANADGTAASWQTLSNGSDLPCFVERIKLGDQGGSAGHGADGDASPLLLHGAGTTVTCQRSFSSTDW